MSTLATALGELRIMAKRHAGTWQVYHLQRGLRLAWKVEDDAHHILLGREGVMPSLVEERVVMDNLPTGLVPVSCERDEKRFRVYWVLRKGGKAKEMPNSLYPGDCPGCRKGEAPVLLDEHGTLSSISGLPGRLGHGVDDFWWYCDQYPATREG